MIYVIFYFNFFILLLTIYIAVCIFTAFMTIYAANAVYSILFLISTFLLAGIFFILLGIEYLGLVLMLVYIGAIAILFLFVLMLLDLKNLTNQYVSFGSMLCFVFFIFCFSEYLLHYFQLGPTPFFLTLMPPLVFAGQAHTVLLNDALLVLSLALYNTHFYYIIGCGFILLFIMIGVVLLLSEQAFPFHNKRHPTQNKFLIRYRDVVKNSRLL